MMIVIKKMIVLKKNESSRYTDFILSEDDDEGIIEKNIHTLTFYISKINIRIF